MNVVAALVAMLATLLSALCTAADGALLAGSAPPGAPGGSRAEESTLPHGDARDRTHRALSIVRIVMYLIAGIAGAIALGLRESGPAWSPVAALVLALLIVLVGESTPRAWGERRGAPVLAALTPMVRAVEAGIAPLVAAGVWVDAQLLRVLPAAAARSVSRDPGTEPFRLVFRTQTQLPVVQRDILHRYSALADTEVQEVMVPRVDIIGIERETPWSEVVDRVRSQQHSRLPVYVETLDHIHGILFAKDILLAVIDGEEPAGGWGTKVRPAAFIPEGKSAESQLRDFKSTHNHLAIVVDEFGGTAGLVTIENILEEIVGEIRDETDVEEAPIVRGEDGEHLWISGKVTLDELSEALGHHFALDDVSTVGGLVFHRFGRVPKNGERTEIDGFSFTVERVVRRRIDRVYVEKPAPVAEEERA